MNKSIQLVVFTLDEQRFALNLSAVERVVRVVEITPIPKIQSIILGVVNFQGNIIPVVNVRMRIRMPEREMQLGDQLLICSTSARTVAFPADSCEGVTERSEQEIIEAEKILPDLEYIEGVVKLEDDIVFIYNLDKFLSLEEEKALEEVIEEQQSKEGKKSTNKRKPRGKGKK